MKTRLSELRRLIRTTLVEVERETIAAQVDPNEQEFAKEFPTWRHPRETPIQDPFRIKAKQVAAILANWGMTRDAAKKKVVVHQLLPFIQEMDVTDLFVSDPIEIATNFSREVLQADR